MSDLITQIHSSVNDVMNQLSFLDNAWTFKRLRGNLYAAYHSGYREALITVRVHDGHLDLILYDVGPIEFADGSIEVHIHVPDDIDEGDEVAWFEANLITELNRLHGIK